MEHELSVNGLDAAVQAGGARLKDRLWFRRAQAARRVAAEQERSVISAADMRSVRVRSTLMATRVIIFIGLFIVGLGPLLWLFKASLSTTQDTLRAPLAMFPSGVHWGNLATAWTVGDISQYFFNTVVMALGSLIGNLLVSISAAYVLSVLRPRWGRVLSGAIIATLFIPSVVSLVPLYLTVIRLPLVGTDLLNTYWAVWLPAAASAFNIVIIKRFFDGIPTEMVEAATIDGAGAARLLLHIVLPLSRPILAVVSLITVIGSWKEFLWPLLVLQNPQVQPLSVALPLLTNTTALSVQLAAMFLAVLFPMVLFLLFQRQFLRGVGMVGVIKG